MKIALIPIIFLAVVMGVSALDIYEPVDGWTYYTSINDANISFNNASISNCYYRINNQQSVNIPLCTSNFIFDVPYDNGSVEFIVFENNGTDLINSSVTFHLKDTFTQGKGIIVSILILLPLLIAFGFWFLARWLDDSHIPFKLFLLLLGFVFVMASYNYGNLAIREYLHFSYLGDSWSSGFFSYGMIFFVVMSYFIIMFFITMIRGIGELIGK